MPNTETTTPTPNTVLPKFIVASAGTGLRLQLVATELSALLSNALQHEVQPFPLKLDEVRLLIGQPMPTGESTIVFSGSTQKFLVAGSLTGSIGFVDIVLSQILIPHSNTPRLDEGVPMTAIEIPGVGIEPQFQKQGLFRILACVLEAYTDGVGIVLSFDNVVDESLIRYGRGHNYRLIEGATGYRQLVHMPP